MRRPWPTGGGGCRPKNKQQTKTQVAFMIHTNSAHCTLHIHLKVNFPFKPRYFKWSFALILSNRNFFDYLNFFLHATRPAYLIRLDFITLQIFGRKQKIMKHPPFHSFLPSCYLLQLGPNTQTVIINLNLFFPP